MVQPNETPPVQEETITATGDAIILSDAFNNLASAIREHAAAVRELAKPVELEEGENRQYDMAGRPIG